MSYIRSRDQRLGDQLASHQFDSCVAGKPLKIPQVNFTIPLEKKIQALSGPPYFAVRARRIEHMTDQLIEKLTAKYSNMIEKFGSRPNVFARKWKELIEGWPLDRLNDLIEKHNKYFPIEANLPIDPRSEALMFGSAAWQPKEKITVESLRNDSPRIYLLTPLRNQLSPTASNHFTHDAESRSIFTLRQIPCLTTIWKVT